MPSFALITEGITDQAALELILSGYYRVRLDGDIDVNPLQPPRDETDQSRLPRGDFGGWELVFEFCSFHDRIREALAFNDYLVIQVDTDCGDHPNYAVPLTVGGRDRPVPDLIAAVKTKIIGILGPELYQAHQDRIFFAICVHALECWLIPLHEIKTDKKNQTNGCTNRLQRILSGTRIRFAKDYPSYTKIAGGYLKKGAVAKNTEFNESFAIFIRSLPDLDSEDRKPI